MNHLRVFALGLLALLNFASAISPGIASAIPLFVSSEKTKWESVPEAEWRRQFTGHVVGPLTKHPFLEILDRYQSHCIQIGQTIENCALIDSELRDYLYQGLTNFGRLTHLQASPRDLFELFNSAYQFEKQDSTNEIEYFLESSNSVDPQPNILLQKDIGRQGVLRWGKILGTGQFKEVEAALRLKDFSRIARQRLVLQEPTSKANLIKIAEIERSNHNAIKLFNHEGSLMLRLSQLLDQTHQSHEGIVRTLDFTPAEFGKEGVIYQDYYYTDLFEILAGRVETAPLSDSERLSIAKQVAQGVATLHRLGIAHMDLKPENILIRWKASPSAQRLIEAAITDFGFAILPENFISDGAVIKRRPRSGTFEFMAPEIMKNEWKGSTETLKENGLKADVFALGSIVYSLLHYEEVPWNRDRVDYKTVSNPDDEREKVRLKWMKYYEEIPNYDNYISLVLRTWHSDPEKRLSADSVLHAIKSVNSQRRIRRPKMGHRLTKHPMFGFSQEKAELQLEGSLPGCYSLYPVTTTLGMRVGLSYISQDLKLIRKVLNESPFHPHPLRKEIQYLESIDLLTREPQNCRNQTNSEA